jgi:hypothetical protein
VGKHVVVHTRVGGTLGRVAVKDAKGEEHVIDTPDLEGGRVFDEAEFCPDDAAAKVLYGPAGRKGELERLTRLGAIRPATAAEAQAARVEAGVPLATSADAEEADLDRQIAAAKAERERLRFTPPPPVPVAVPVPGAAEREAAVQKKRDALREEQEALARERAEAQHKANEAAQKASFSDASSRQAPHKAGK